MAFSLFTAPRFGFSAHNFCNKNSIITHQAEQSIEDRIRKLVQHVASKGTIGPQLGIVPLVMFAKSCLMV